MMSHSASDKLQRRTRELAAAKRRLRDQLAAQAAGAVQNRANPATGGQGAAAGPR
jgi:hypothetical protein